jgi:transketolase
VKLTKQAMGWPQDPPFLIPDKALAHFRLALENGKRAEAEWNVSFSEYSKAFPVPAKEFEKGMSGQLPENWQEGISNFPADPEGMETRAASGKVLNPICQKLPSLIGGSADLDPSTKTELKAMGDFKKPQDEAGNLQGSAGGGWSYGGPNLHFGVPIEVNEASNAYRTAIPTSARSMALCMPVGSIRSRFTSPSSNGKC